MNIDQYLMRRIHSLHTVSVLVINNEPASGVQYSFYKNFKSYYNKIPFEFLRTPRLRTIQQKITRRFDHYNNNKLQLNKIISLLIKIAYRHEETSMLHQATNLNTI